MSLRLEIHWSATPAWWRLSNLTLCCTRDPAAPSTLRTVQSRQDQTTWWATPTFRSDTEPKVEAQWSLQRFWQCYSKVLSLLGLSQSFFSVVPVAARTAGGGCEIGHGCPFRAESLQHLHKRSQCSGRGVSVWVLVHRSRLARLGYFGLEQTHVLHRERGETA